MSLTVSAHFMATTVTFNPALSHGLNFESSTGKLYGRLSGAMPETTFTVSATNSVTGTTHSTDIKLTITPFEPTTIAGLKVWLKADTGLYSDLSGATPAAYGTPVRRWKDQSTLGNDFIRTDENHIPTAITDGINSLPSMRFIASGGVATAMCLSPGGNTCENIFTGTRTIFAVAAVARNTDYWQYLYATRDYSSPATQTNIVLGGPSVVDSDLHWTAEHSGDLLTTFPASHVVITDPFLTYHQSYATDAANLFIGAGLNVYIPFDGKFSEFLVFEGNLSDEDAATVNRYLAAKYGISNVP